MCFLFALYSPFLPSVVIKTVLRVSLKLRSNSRRLYFILSCLEGINYVAGFFIFAYFAWKIIKFRCEFLFQNMFCILIFLYTIPRAMCSFLSFVLSYSFATKWSLAYFHRNLTLHWQIGCSIVQAKFHP